MRLIYLFIYLAIIGCTDEPNTSTRNVSVENQTVEIITITTFLDEEPIETIVLQPNTKGLNCSYSSEFFIGYSRVDCSIDKIEFRFLNDTGYISTINEVSNLDFPNESSPFGDSVKFHQTNNDYTFIITQEDFDNAFEL